MAEPGTNQEEQPIQAEALLGLSPELVAAVAVALDDEDRFAARIHVEPLRAPELADLLQLLRPELRHRLIEYMRPDFDPQILPELEEDVRDEIAEQLGTKSLAHAVARLSPMMRLS